jgi:hypothetical protein
MKPFKASELASLQNEWMRRFTENPEAFEAQFKTATLFLAERQAGRVPTYGETCVAYLDFLRSELSPPTIDKATEPQDHAAAVLALLRKPRRKPSRRRNAKR